jgi:hypothetical protein
MRRWRALAFVPLAVLLVTGPVLAQDEAATEEEGGESTRLVAPEECVTEPRTPEDIATILNLAGEGVESPPMMQITPPLGEIADAETTISVKEAIRTFLACSNAGDLPRGASLLTENGVQRAFWGQTRSPEARAAAMELISAEPRAREEAGLVRLLAVTDVSVLPDGRIATFVVLNEPLGLPNGPETLLFILANQDGQWLIDDRINFSIIPADSGAAATPAP